MVDTKEDKPLTDSKPSSKRDRIDHQDVDVDSVPKAKRPSITAEETAENPPRPYPYFFYTDRSREVDPDPFTPITKRDQSPIFPMKLHALLSNPMLRDVIAWDDHGRSFRILKRREFEEKVMPRYFEHTKLGSFTRQVNGWGFRRLKEGLNRSSYFEENFLRDMPWLCKNMGRHKVGGKGELGADHEPDLVAISNEWPLRKHPRTREMDVVMEVMEKGPKARMPLTWAIDAPVSPAQPSRESVLARNMPSTSQQLLERYDRSLIPNAMPNHLLGNFGPLGLSMLGAPNHRVREAELRRNSRGDISAESRDAVAISESHQAAILQFNANISALAAARHRANAAQAQLAALSYQEAAMRLQHQNELIANLQTGLVPGSKEVEEINAQTAAANLALARQQHRIRAMSGLPPGYMPGGMECTGANAQTVAPSDLAQAMQLQQHHLRAFSGSLSGVPAPMNLQTAAFVQQTRGNVERTLSSGDDEGKKKAERRVSDPDARIG